MASTLFTLGILLRILLDNAYSFLKNQRQHYNVKKKVTAPFNIEAATMLMRETILLVKIGEANETFEKAILI